MKQLATLIFNQIKGDHHIRSISDLYYDSDGKEDAPSPDIRSHNN